MELIFVEYNKSKHQLCFKIIPQSQNEIATIDALRGRLMIQLAESLDMHLLHNKVTSLYIVDGCRPMSAFIAQAKKIFMDAGVTLKQWTSFISQMKSHGLVVDDYKATESWSAQQSSLRGYTTYPFLNTQDMARLSATSSFFNQDTNFDSYWINKIKEAGCDKYVLQEAISTNTINDYRRLYFALIKLAVDGRRQIVSCWELLCLSGSKNAFLYARNTLQISISTTSINNYHFLHLLALSGNASTFLLAISRHLPKSFDWMQKNDEDDCLLDLSALGGDSNIFALVKSNMSIQTEVTWSSLNSSSLANYALRGNNLDIVKQVIALMGNNFDLITKAPKGRSILFRALVYSTKEIIDYLARYQGFADGINDKDDGLHNCLHYAVRNVQSHKLAYLESLLPSKSQYKLKVGNEITHLHLAVESGDLLTFNHVKKQLGADFDPSVLTDCEWNIAHCAAGSSNLKLLKTCIKLLPLNFDLTTIPNNGNNLMRMAALFGCEEMITYLRQLAVERGFTWDYKQKDDDSDVFDLIETRRCSEQLKVALREALLKPLDELIDAPQPVVAINP